MTKRIYAQDAGRKHEEQDEQKALMQICQMHEWKWPELESVYHVPNGGYRRKVEAAILSSVGVKSGVPDVVLPAARRGWFGLYIEMKRPGAKKETSKNQRWWLNILRIQGYMSVVCDSADEAWRIMRWYLIGEKTVPVNAPEIYEVVDKQNMA